MHVKSAKVGVGVDVVRGGHSGKIQRNEVLKQVKLTEGKVVHEHEFDERSYLLQSDLHESKLQGYKALLHELNTDWLLLPKLLYFTLNMALYSSLTFTSAYFFDKWGLQIYQFGAISSLSIVELIGAVYWGGLADRTGHARMILIGCTMAYGLSFGLLPIVEMIIPEGSEGLKMLLSMVLMGSTYFFMSAFFPLVDACVLGMLANGDVKWKFGRQRLWGTIGHAVITLLSAQMIELWGWLGMFITMIAACLLFIGVILLSLPKTPVFLSHLEVPEEEEEEEENSTEDSTIFFPKDDDLMPLITNHPVIDLIKNFHFAFFLMIVLLTGYSRAVLSTFLPFYLLVDLHQSTLFVGLTSLFRISSEILIFALCTSKKEEGSGGSSLTTKAREYQLILIGLVTGVIRLFGYSQLGRLVDSNPLWIYFSVFTLELLKGVSVACLVSGAVRLAHDLSPPKHSSTAQALLSGVYSGLSTALSGLIGGAIIYADWEHRIDRMFLGTAFGGILAILTAIVKFGFYDGLLW